MKDQIPDWLGHKLFLLHSFQWLGFFLLLILGYICLLLVHKYAAEIIVKIFERKQIATDNELVKRLIRSAGWIGFSLIWITGIHLLMLPSFLLKVLYLMTYIGFVVAVIVSTVRLVDLLSYYFGKRAEKTPNKFDDLLVPIMQKSSKVVIIALGIVAVGDGLKFDMKSIVAGLGIGGLAFALAAKDSLSNIFGSMTVLIDRPFSIGDWIVIGNDIEGTVIEVGLRSTRIKTFYDSVITVPNGQLTNIQIDNYGKRQYRRYKADLSIQYDTPPEKIEAFCEGIRQIILGHHWTRKDYFHVYFNNMADSSLNILLYVFWEVPDWSAELQERHRLLLDILRLANDMEISFAFPTQTLHMFKEERPASAETIPEEIKQKAPHIFGKNKATQITEKQITTAKHRSGTAVETFSEKDISL